MDKEPITVNGLKKLKLELEDLKNIQKKIKKNNCLNVEDM